MCVRTEWLSWLLAEGEVTQLTCSALCGPSLETSSSRWTLVFISTSVLSHWGTWSDHAVCLPYALRKGLKDPFPLVREIPPRNPSTPLIPWRSTLVGVIWKLRATHDCSFLKSHLAVAQHSAALLSNISCYLDSSIITWLGLRIDHESESPRCARCFTQLVIPM